MPVALSQVPSHARLCEVCPPDFEADTETIPECTAEAYQPLPYQHEFFNLDSPTKAIIGGIGIGKTTIGSMQGLYAAFGYNPEPHVGLIGAPTFPMLRDAVLPAIQRTFPPDTFAGGRWDTGFSKSHMILTLCNGSKIVFRSLDRENYHKVRGIEVAWLWIDEARLLTSAEAFDVCLGRLRQRARRRFAWVTTTPNGEDWVAVRWILKALEGYKYVHAKSSDNPYLPPDFFERLRATYSEEYLRQELDGEILSMHGAVYRSLRQELWPLGNVIPYEAQEGSSVDLCVDFGVRRPSCLAIATLQAMNPNTMKPETIDCVVWELQSDRGGPPFDMRIDDIVAAVKASGLRVRRVFGDPAGDSRNDQTHITSARKLCKMLGVGRFIKPTKPWQTSKQHGEEVVRSRIQPYKGGPKLVWACSEVLDRLGRPTLRAPNSFKSHQQLRYPEHKPGKPQPVVSLKDGVNDHDTDAMRYRLIMLYGKEGAFWGTNSRPSHAAY